MSRLSLPFEFLVLARILHLGTELIDESRLTSKLFIQKAKADRGLGERPLEFGKVFTHLACVDVELVLNQLMVAYSHPPKKTRVSPEQLYPSQTKILQG